MAHSLSSYPSSFKDSMIKMDAWENLIHSVHTGKLRQTGYNDGWHCISDSGGSTNRHNRLLTELNDMVMQSLPLNLLYQFCTSAQRSNNFFTIKDNSLLCKASNQYLTAHLFLTLSIVFVIVHE